MSKSIIARSSKEEYYLNIAFEVARRGTCLRRGFGAVIVNNDQIVSTGYVGAPRGVPNCLDISRCYRKERKIPKGEHYEKCRSVHAEMNAIIHAARERMIDGTIYIAGVDLENKGKPMSAMPCKLCRRIIINAGITRVVVSKETGGFRELFPKHWIAASQVNPFAELDEEGY